jgi:UDP-N-acetylglucosamine--N-acetylmuramyl-(pentapeptide) pyrophosphoryl-undecaprenol N-acetylglucosamine transferase
VSLAAALCGVPVALLETNSVVGLANRILAPVARRAYVAYESAAGRFPKRIRRTFGVPLRAGFARAPYVPRDVPRVLVMGGSQGAEALNERVPQALGRLRGHRAIEVLHQSGRGREPVVRAAYERAGIHADVVPFVDDPANAMAASDLIVSRSGSATLAEISAIGRAALLIPFPHATGDHQRYNAEEVARLGAAVCVAQDLATVERIASDIERLLADVPLRTAMAEAAARRGRPGAAREIAIDLLALAGIDRRERPGDDDDRRRADRTRSAGPRTGEA